MASYPSYPQLTTSIIDRQAGIVLDVMESGLIRGSDGYDKDVVSIVCQHFLTATDYNALKSFWVTNRGNPIDFVYDGDSEPITYSAIIRSINDRWHASGKYFVRVELLGNPQ